MFGLFCYVEGFKRFWTQEQRAERTELRLLIIVSYTSSKQITLKCFRIDPKANFASFFLLFGQNICVANFFPDNEVILLA